MDRLEAPEATSGQTDVSSANSFELLERARVAEYGILFGVRHARAAYTLRRQLYLERDRQRRRGVTDHDGLSFLVRAPTTRDYLRWQVWIVKRDKTRGGPRTFLGQAREIALEEMPLRIGARGPHRLGLMTILDIYRALRSRPVDPSELLEAFRNRL